MTQVTIKSLTHATTSTGKAKINATLVDTNGVQHQNVTIWGDFPNFQSLAQGMQVEGSIYEKQNGNFVNKTLYPPKDQQTTPPRRSPSAMTKIMDRKEESIDRSQEKKALNIKLSSTIGSAVLLAIAEKGTKEWNMTDLQESVHAWREWLWNEWDNTGNFQPFN